MKLKIFQIGTKINVLYFIPRCWYLSNVGYCIIKSAKKATYELRFGRNLFVVIPASSIELQGYFDLAVYPSNFLIRREALLRFAILYFIVVDAGNDNGSVSLLVFLLMFF
ncbi:MAG: hypothetical protein CMIDDMOC_00140 [Sodalis sp. Fle]|nr:MAG: hypothetical protein CMIDDMOC_00140 [Sodalis sp. Fle]